MVSFRVHSARDQEDERDERDLCKCMGQSHTTLVCTHCPVLKPSETQRWLYYNLFSTGDKWWHSSALWPSLIMVDSSLIPALFQVVPWKGKSWMLSFMLVTSWSYSWFQSLCHVCHSSNSSEGMSLALEVEGREISKTHTHTLMYVTKRRAGGEVVKYNREWVLVSPGWHFEVTALLCAI